MGTQVTELLADGAMRLYRGHSSEVMAEFQISLDVNEDYDGHQWGRPFWFHANLSVEAAQQQQSGAQGGQKQLVSNTYDIRVLDWRCAQVRVVPSSVALDLQTIDCRTGANRETRDVRPTI